MFMKPKHGDEEFWKEDELIDLGKHVGSMNSTLPPFGYPTMNFNENPLELVKLGVIKINDFDDLDAVKGQIEHFVTTKHHKNWRTFLNSTSKAMPCRGQLYQKHKLDRAFEIIEKSFTYGAKLKRNPVSDHERVRLEEKNRIEGARFELYRRAWQFKFRKSRTIAG